MSLPSKVTVAPHKFMKHTIHKHGKEFFVASIHVNGVLVRGFGKDPKEAVSHARQLSKRY